MNLKGPAWRLALAVIGFGVITGAAEAGWAFAIDDGPGGRSWGAGPGRGGKAAFCRNYASNAVDSEEANRRRDCDFTGPRWHADYDNHFQWCLNHPRGRALSETEMRREQLRECRDYGGGDPQFCRSYARRAVSAQEINEQLDCGFTGPGWHWNRARHYDWCLNASPERARREARIRTNQIRRCRS